MKKHREIVKRILEQHGMTLPGYAIVHHIDGNPKNDTKDNFVVCPGDGYHKLLHLRTEALEACGNANFRKCVKCHKYDNVDNMRIHGKARTNLSYIHIQCRRDADNKYAASKRNGA